MKTETQVGSLVKKKGIMQYRNKFFHTAHQILQLWWLNEGSGFGENTAAPEAALMPVEGPELKHILHMQTPFVPTHKRTKVSKQGHIMYQSS